MKLFAGGHLLTINKDLSQDMNNAWGSGQYFQKTLTNVTSL